ncbi:hypothetical protein EHI42_19775 [Rhizobium hidalgonense]|uniref:hypothetical protein n=1 Tax=Rhizobium hidalgonense TaxID=1538159 RepID=UPI000FF6D27D|nr:hypothetical protein [Rhizobium hidalgonense]RWX13636.1 hypothetical protein EHI42_19775 [Rhizobium hidalgonense]
MGTLDIDTGSIQGAGVRWRQPDTFRTDSKQDSKFHTEPYGTAFEAARSLLGFNRHSVARKSEIPLKALAALEAGRDYSSSEYLRLRDYYTAAGIEFMGIGDVRSGLYYGVGVRWAKPSPEGAD